MEACDQIVDNDALCCWYDINKVYICLAEVS